MRILKLQFKVQVVLDKFHLNLMGLLYSVYLSFDQMIL